eukprot:jgi/Ulvmu1/5363/UM022_0157.1
MTSAALVTFWFQSRASPARRRDVCPRCHLSAVTRMKVVRENVDYDCDGTVLKGYAAYMDENPQHQKAAVMVAHTAIGPHDDFIQDVLTNLALSGYVAFALDLFGAADVVTGADKERANAQLRERRELIAERATAALHVVQRMQTVDANRIAAIGYCLGGKCVLDLARSGAHLQGVVSFHGILDRWETAGDPMTARVLAFHGRKDPFVTPSMLEGFLDEMEQRDVEYEIRLYGANVMHAFTRSEKNTPDDADAGFQFCPRVAHTSWESTLEFLEEALGMPE